MAERELIKRLMDEIEDNDLFETVARYIRAVHRMQKKRRDKRK